MQVKIAFPINNKSRTTIQYKNKVAIQCIDCQAFEHTQIYYYKSAERIKFNEDHKIENFRRPK